MRAPLKAKLILKGLFNNILGISVEVLAGVAFMAIGFLVCAFWWSIIR